MNGLFQWLTQAGITPFALVGYLALGIVAWNNMRWRLRILETGQKDTQFRFGKMELIIDKQAEVTRAVEVNSAKLAVIAEMTERRLRLLEDRLGK